MRRTTERALDPGAPHPTRLLLASPHELLRTGLRITLDREPDVRVLAEAADAAATVAAVIELLPEVALIDLALGAPGGFEVTRRIRRSAPTVAVVVLGDGETDDDVIAALRAGAAAYVRKDLRPSDLVELVRRAAAGEYLINERVFARPGVARRLVGEFGQLAVFGPAAEAVFAPLSPRELEVLQSIAQGRTNKLVAAHLTISEQTVKNHMSSILRKLAVNDRTQAVVQAMREGWIRWPSEQG
jgi:DNA-binding NarL/FixJ family response regulator